MPLHEITLADGSTRRMGNLVPSAGPQRSFPVLGDTPTAVVIPENSWDSWLQKYSDVGPEDPWIAEAKDQDGVGQCNPTAAVTALEYCRRRQGLPQIDLSAADLYDRINWGRDGGSLLEDAMHELLVNGVGTEASCGFLWKNGYWKGPASPAERSRFRFLEVFLCPTFVHMFSAALQGFALVSGILWYDNYNVDQDGWLPSPSGRSGGHAIMGYKPTKRGRNYGIWHRQSWGPSWGAKGSFAIPQAAFNGPIGGWYAVRAVTDEGGVVPQPVAA